MFYNKSFVQSPMPIYPNVLNSNESFQHKIDLETKMSKMKKKMSKMFFCFFVEVVGDEKKV